MLKFVTGLLLVALGTSSRIRAQYRVLDPFSPNGLWSEVPNSDNEPVPAQALTQEDEQDDNGVSLVEKDAAVTSRPPLRSQNGERKPAIAKKEHPPPPKPGGTKKVVEQPPVVHHFIKESAVPYLPDLTALKQITGAGTEASPLALSALTALKHPSDEHARTHPSKGRKPNPKHAKAASNSDTNRQHRSLLPPESSFNVAPAMPQLPSLAAATNAPLPPEYPRWDPLPRPPATSLLEMGTSSGHSRTADGLTPSPPPESGLFGARVSWPSDVSPPPDYFLPPEVLI